MALFTYCRAAGGKFYQYAALVIRVRQPFHPAFTAVSYTHRDVYKGQGEDRYVFRDKSGEINVVIPAAVFDGREVQPDQLINISGSLDKKSAPAVVRVTHLQK